MGALGRGSRSILISDVLKCSCWRPPRQPKQESRPGKSVRLSGGLQSAKENINLTHPLEHQGEHLLRRHFGNWADIELYQVQDIGFGSNTYDKGHQQSEVGEGVSTPPCVDGASVAASFKRH